VRAQSITDEIAIAAARALAGYASAKGLRRDYILPRMDEWDVAAHIAAAVGLRAQAQGLARLRKSQTELFDGALKTIGTARKALTVLMESGIISPQPR
jgi:malate dehydrogenase (oxaloacetate-decarboxylating)